MQIKNYLFVLLFTVIGNVSLSQTVYVNGTEYYGIVNTCYQSVKTLTVSVTGNNSPDSIVWRNWINWDSVWSRSFSYIGNPGDMLTFGLIDNGVETQYDLSIVEEDQVTISQSVSTYSGKNISTYGGNDGYILLDVTGGFSPYSYSWSNSVTTKNDTLLSAGSYSVTVTDAHGCTSTASRTLTQPAQPLTLSSLTAVSYNGYNISKNGARDGKFKVNVVGGIPPYSLLVDYTKCSIDTIRDRGAKTYGIIVEDKNGDTIHTSITLTEPQKLLITLTPHTYTVNGHSYNVSCHGCANGIIHSTITGGVTPYTYKWSTGQTTDSISSLSYGYYNLEITDANGATSVKEIFLTAPENEEWSLSGNTGIDSTIQQLNSWELRITNRLYLKQIIFPDSKLMAMGHLIFFQIYRLLPLNQTIIIVFMSIKPEQCGSLARRVIPVLYLYLIYGSIIIVFLQVILS